ncbi:MAG: CDP-glucose 4,6-dehydratase [Thaumarchaeota archaeon]|nr:MAG: CDP-glucose 4,6-dehydratase [Nitrososphaerota archaeon]
MTPSFWNNKRVLITGHTGFKGSWLSIWLKKLGAEVIGFSNLVPTNPSLYELSGINSDIISVTGDIRDLQTVQNTFLQYKPQIVIHMAAQSLVGPSYNDPVETYSTNVMGTVNLFEAIRKSNDTSVIINVTSDKCYENKETLNGYVETDKLGGYDPYSNSKACSELVTSSFRNSFFNDHPNGKNLASVRAGNIIGGGDWSDNRLIPDIMKSLKNETPLKLRNPDGVRPWQHVLDPLYGYLILAEHLWTKNRQFSEAWNFGPEQNSIKPVSWIIDQISEYWGSSINWEKSTQHFHETHVLSLNCSKSKSELNWSPKLNLIDSIKWTVDWFKEFYNKSDMRKITEKQIDDFVLL